MKTKQKFLWLLLALLVGGANGAWADLNFQIIANDLEESATRIAIANGITSNDGNIKITFISGGSGSEVSWQSSDSKYQDKTKTLTPASIKFQPGSSFKVEGLNGTKIKQVYLYGISSERQLAVGETPLTSADDTNWWVRYWAPTEAFDEVTISNPSTGNAYIYNIYIVYKATPTLSFANGGTGSLKIGAGASSDNYSSYLSHSGDGAISYSLPSTNTAGATINVSTGVVNVTSAGTVVVRATSAETETYNSNYAEYTLSVTKGSEPYSGNDITTQTYPHTWDFTTSSSDWTSSQTQMITTYGDWGGSGTYYYQTNTYASYPTGYAIDVIKGLRFSHHWIGLDWGYGHLWFGGGGSITIPSLATGQIITIVMDGRGDGATTVTAPNTSGSSYSVSSTGTHQEYTYTVESSGDIVFTFDKNISIRSISVTNPTATWTYNATDADMDESRPNKGCITFDNVIGGVLPTGTVINEVPGITYTFTKGSTDLHIASVSENNRYQGNVLMGTSNDTGAKIVISPQVHGFISLQGNFYENCTITNTTDSRTEWTAPMYTYYKTLTEINIPLIAGKTYELSGGAYAWELHAIAFRPAFLQPDLSAEQTTKFEATTATPKSAYPKLITAAQAGTVRFSENTWTAYLYDNNDVELNGYGDNLYVRGRVYAPAPHQDNQLNAYYLLYANVLQLTSNSPTTDATTNDVYLSSLSGNTFTFTFNQTLTNHDASKVKVYKDGSTSPMSSGVSVSRSDANLVVTFSTSPAAGETYRIVVEKDAVIHSAAKNAEIIRTFSITSSAEPPISMIWPTGVARVGDPIVLQTNVVGTGTEDDNVTPKQVGIDNSFTVTGTLKAEGETDRIIKANIVANRLVFKPETPLSNNKTYTLYLPASNYNSDIPIASSTNIPSGTTGVVMAKNSKESNSRRVLKHDKSFVFKTATSSGSEPTMTGSSPSNLQKGNISYDNGTIKITFDQAVEITPYTTINATPVNGSESTAHGSTALSGEAATLYIDNSNNRTICFDYLADGLKYDLWTEVVIPANSIIGTGGKPNTEEIKFRFKMDRNPNSTPVDAEIFYPHTWDFNRFGVNTSTITNIGQQISQSGTDGTNKNYLKSQKNVLQSKRQDNYLTYVSHKFSDTDYDQGNDVYIMLGNGDGTGTKYKLPEFEGLRISLVNKTSDRFEIRDLGDYQKANEEDTGSGQLNADETHKYIFRLNGNTHYVTLSNVPAGKLYMVVNAPHLGINSPNATFANVAGATIDNNGTLMNTNGTKKVVVNVTEAGDVSFCVKNFSCEKIAVSDYSKTFKSTFAVNGKSYATDCVNEGIRHDLVKAFTGDEVKAYYVSATSENIATATELKETTTSTATSKGGEGVIVVLQKPVGADTEIPFFVTDVNTAVNTSKNLLKGTTTVINNFDNSQKNKYFFSNVYTQLSKDKTELEGTPEWITTTQMGFYRAVGSTVSAHKAWLEVPTSGGSARQYYLFKFFDDGETPTAIDGVETKTVNDDAWYSLQGVRVTNPVKGNLYIHNGKKVVIK